MRRRYAIFDADFLVVRAGVMHQREIAWHNGAESQITDLKEAIGTIYDEIRYLCRELNARPIVCAGDPSRLYFRHDVYSDYKIRRTANPPVLLPEIRQFLDDEFGLRWKPGLEGEDVAGILFTHPTLLKGDKVMIGIDKDLHTLPGTHWRLTKSDKPFEIPEYEADFFTAYQALTGDTIDDYPGLKGCGPKCAMKYLEPWYEWRLGTLLQEGVATAFMDKQPEDSKDWDKAEADALQMIRLARILRWTDYDYDNQEVKLWTP